MSAERAEFLLADIVNAIRDDVVVAMQSGRKCKITVNLSHSKIKNIVPADKGHKYYWNIYSIFAYLPQVYFNSLTFLRQSWYTYETSISQNT